jgi:hypothetical protein
MGAWHGDDYCREWDSRILSGLTTWNNQCKGTERWVVKGFPAHEGWV